MGWTKEQDGEYVKINTLDDVPDGVTWKRSANNFSDADKAKLDALIQTPLTADETVTLINASAITIDATRLNGLPTASQLAGADNAVSFLDSNGLKNTALIGGTVASSIETKANDAFQKTADSLDDIPDGTTHKLVNAEYVGAGGEINALHDGTTKRELGVANGIPVMDANAKLGTTTMPEAVVQTDGSGNLVKGDGPATPITLDKVSMTGDYKAVKVKTGEEDMRTNTLFADPLLSLSGNAQPRIYSTNDASGYTLFCAIPVVFDNLDMNLKMKIFARMVAGSGTPTGKIRIICRDDDGGKPDSSPFVNNYQEVDVTRASFDKSELEAANFFTSWSLVEGTLYWITIEAKVTDALDTLEMTGPLIYLESKIVS